MKNNIAKKVLGIFITGILLSIMLISFSACSNEPSSPVEIVGMLDKMIEKSTPGDKGPVLAKIEDDVIYKKIFDLKLDMILKNTPRMSPQAQLRARNNPKLLKGYLQTMVSSKVILKEMMTDPSFKKDPEFLLFINITMVEAIQKYYLNKKLGGSISTNVTQKEIGVLYDKMMKIPRYRKIFSRIPMKRVNRVLTSEILKQRQQKAIQSVMGKLQGKYRIDLKDHLLGGGKSGSKKKSKKK